MQLTYNAPCAKLEKLENLWLQLSNISCNIKCKHCYLDCHHNIKKKNFLSFEKISEFFSNDFRDLKKIYLTGGEPFLHPKINDILRLTLNINNVCVYSNGTLLTEKKIKLIKEIEDNTRYNLSFKLSLDHFSEGRNDEYRARGVFKKVLNALLLSQKYHISTEVACVNLKNEDVNYLKDGFLNLFEKHGINIQSKDIKILPMLNLGNYAKYYHISDFEKNVKHDDIKNFDLNLLDCKNSRVLTIDGIYACPALVNDPRAKVGQDISNSSPKMYLETETCYECVSRNEKMFC